MSEGVQADREPGRTFICLRRSCAFSRSEASSAMTSAFCLVSSSVSLVACVIDRRKASTWAFIDDTDFSIIT